MFEVPAVSMLCTLTRIQVAVSVRRNISQGDHLGYVLAVLMQRAWCGGGRVTHPATGARRRHLVRALPRLVLVHPKVDDKLVAPLRLMHAVRTAAELLDRAPRARRQSTDGDRVLRLDVDDRRLRLPA